MKIRRHDEIDLGSLIGEHARQVQNALDRLAFMRSDLRLLGPVYARPCTPNEIRKSKQQAQLIARIANETHRLNRHRNALAALAARGVIAA